MIKTVTLKKMDKQMDNKKLIFSFQTTQLLAVQFLQAP